MSPVARHAVRGKGGDDAAPSSLRFDDSASAMAHEEKTGIAGETRKALEALRTDPTHASRYADFLAAIVYGEQTAYGDAMTTVTALAARGLT
jgi:hypothetical protein